MNPFKYGVLVDNEYFTDRSEELKDKWEDDLMYKLLPVESIYLMTTFLP